jgi:hypothetical protein
MPGPISRKLSPFSGDMALLISKIIAGSER